MLSGEQIGFGGYNTVRGYEDREFNSDKGVILSLEARSPAFSLFSSVLNGEPIQDQLRLIAFMDYGIGANNNRLIGESYSTDLWSAGLGFRYNINTNVTLRFDYGWQLEQTGLTQDDSGNAHIGIVISY